MQCKSLPAFALQNFPSHDLCLFFYEQYSLCFASYLLSITLLISTGFSIKSTAPAFIASTPLSTVMPCEEDYNLEVRVLILKTFQRLYAAQPLHYEVKDDCIEIPLLCMLYSFLPACKQYQSSFPVPPVSWKTQQETVLRHLLQRTLAFSLSQT